ncbi:unnamed protein product [Dovyalis caffra]|uniref:Pectinesterase inhibitor domain-containing protein n=1 Tax=Dovyalis caffra TaxID=77055 RepID=A0AAV1SF11_9ROSI|nr:unnamed protein product [Dovyalis caffra]
MELNKSILVLLISSSLLSFFSKAICVPRNVSSDHASPAPLGPALSKTSSEFIQSTLSSPVSSPVSPFFSPLPSPVSSLPPVSSPSQSPVSHPSPPDSPSVLPSQFNNAELTKICGETGHQAECLAIFGPSLTGAIDALSFLKMGIQTLHEGYEQAMAMATKLIKDPYTDGVVKDCLSVCLDVYDSGITDLDQAFTAMSSHDMDSLVQLLSAVIGYAETCKDAFIEQGGIASPLEEINDRLDTLKLASTSTHELGLKSDPQHPRHG